jgi:uncharacterized lipoprotein YajG
MGKKSKVITMLLVVGTVVFVAGCAEKTNNAENENQAASGQVTPAVTNENMTGNTTAQTGTRISNVERKREIATNHTLSSGTQNVKQKSD